MIGPVPGISEEFEGQDSVPSNHLQDTRPFSAKPLSMYRMPPKYAKWHYQSPQFSRCGPFQVGGDEGWALDLDLLNVALERGPPHGFLGNSGHLCAFKGLCALDTSLITSVGLYAPNAMKSVRSCELLPVAQV